MPKFNKIFIVYIICLYTHIYSMDLMDIQEQLNNINKRSLMVNPSHIKFFPTNTSTQDICVTDNDEIISAMDYKIDEKTKERNSDIIIWDKTEDQHSTLSGHQHGVTALGLKNCNGKEFLASTAYDGAVKLWDIAKRKLLNKFISEKILYNKLCIHDDDILIGSSCSVAVLDFEQLQKKSELTIEKGWLEAITSYPCYNLVSVNTSLPERIAFFDLRQNSEQFCIKNFQKAYPFQYDMIVVANREEIGIYSLSAEKFLAKVKVQLPHPTSESPNESISSFYNLEALHAKNGKVAIAYSVSNSIWEISDNEFDKSYFSKKCNKYVKLKELISGPAYINIMNDKLRLIKEIDMGKKSITSLCFDKYSSLLVGMKGEQNTLARINLQD